VIFFVPRVVYSPRCRSAGPQVRFPTLLRHVRKGFPRELDRSVSTSGALPTDLQVVKDTKEENVPPGWVSILGTLFLTRTEFLSDFPLEQDLPKGLRVSAQPTPRFAAVFSSSLVSGTNLGEFVKYKYFVVLFLTSGLLLSAGFSTVQLKPNVYFDRYPRLHDPAILDQCHLGSHAPSTALGGAPRG